MSAEWRPVPECPGYEVSSEGKVRSVPRIVEYSDGRKVRYPGCDLKPNVVTERAQQREYVNVGKARSKAVHLLVAETFLGKRPGGMFCCHNDGNSLNNSVGNLRWDTPTANSKDMRDHGTNHFLNVQHCPHGHEYKWFNLARSHIKRGHRNCLACSRARGFAQVHPELRFDHKKLSDAYYQLAKDHGPDRRSFGKYKEMIYLAGTSA